MVFSPLTHGPALRTSVLFLALAALWAPANAAPLSPESQRQFDKVIQPFLEEHCYHCHDDAKTRAGFRIDTLGTDFLADKNADNWREIYDNLGAGKMPPKKEAQPTETEVKVVTDWIDQEIRGAAQLAKNSPGRTRRLNRTEYFNSLRDLLFLDDNYTRSLMETLPQDGKVDGFDRGGASLYIDQAQLAKYFELADRVLTERVFTPKPKPTVAARDFARDIKWRKEEEDGKWTKLAARAFFGQIFMGPGWQTPMAYLPTGARIYELKNGGIEYLAGNVLGLHFNEEYPANAGGGMWAGHFFQFLSKVKQEGKYRLKFRAGAFAGKGKYAVENVKLRLDFGKFGDKTNLDIANVIIDAPLDHPKDYVTELYLHPRPEIATSNRAALSWNGVVADKNEQINGVNTQTGVILWAPEIWAVEQAESKEHERLAYQEKRKGTPAQKVNEILTSRFAEVNAKHDRIVKDYIAAKKPVFVYNPDVDLSELPRLFLESVEIEGPILEWPPQGRTALLCEGEDKPIDASYIRDIFAKFLPRAYRRPVEPEEVTDWTNWVLKAQTDYHLSGLDAVKEGVKAVLCSPEFLFLTTPNVAAKHAQPLTDFELASRLSYFLWSTMPDETLFTLAASHKLHEPDTLKSQVSRMLSDARSKGLVEDFGGQWLQVRDFNKTQTDRNQYRTYTEELQRSEWREPYEFFKEVLHSNLSILNFLDSNFVVIDKELADYYGISGIKDTDGFKRVAIGPEQHRGGILGMAGVLTYLTDGFRTLPVRRAAYVKDVLWNEPAKPPPPNVGDLPAIKGKNLTVRERLEQHRNSASCASCHAHLDPFGMALENYDAIGQWRERQNGEGMRGDNRSPALIVSGALPSGREFHNLAEYKQALLEEKDHFVRGFTRKMLTYALGRSVGATDRELVDGVIGKLQSDNYRLQSLVQDIVSSEAFGMK